jgi:hypothetical protein
MSNQHLQVVPMTQQAVDTYGSRSLTAGDIQAQVNLMQDVMRSTMLDGTHYGTIPGTKTKSLFKAGAEKLMATFRLACIPEVEDLGRDGEVHYRVTVKVYSSGGSLLGAGIGECSSQEDKYAWRGALCGEEYDATPENRRRLKFAKSYGKIEKRQQIRTNPADVANTILKMAKKRAQVDAVITVTAASDIFTQDIEDLPEEIREQVAADSRSRPAAQAVAQAIPADSPERDAAIAACRAEAAKGTEHFRAWWKDSFPKESRSLVTDKVADFQAIAASADAMHADKEDAA